VPYYAVPFGERVSTFRCNVLIFKGRSVARRGEARRGGGEERRRRGEAEVRRGGGEERRR